MKEYKEFFNKDYIKNLLDINSKLSEYDGMKLTKEELKQLSEKVGVHDFTLKFFQLRTFGTITVVFSALCLESLINDYCVFKKSATYLSKHVDKLDPVSKWKIFPELFTGKSLASSGKALQLLKELFSFRNSLVHPKSKIVEPVGDVSNEKNPLIQDMAKYMLKVNPIE